MKKDRREDSSAWDFAAFFEEQDASQAIRIHCGGEEIRSLDGVFYGHDRCYLGGRLWHTENNEVAVLYRDARWTTPAEQSFAYAIPLLRGSYQVALHFAEIVEARGAPGKRLFDVAIEGKKVLESFDIAKEA